MSRATFLAAAVRRSRPRPSGPTNTVAAVIAAILGAAKEQK